MIVQGNQLMLSLRTSMRAWLPKRKQTVDSLKTELRNIKIITAATIVGGTGAGALAGLGIGALLSVPTGGLSLIAGPLIGAVLGLSVTGVGSALAANYVDRFALSLQQTQGALDNDRSISTEINTQIQSITNFFESTPDKFPYFNKEEIFASAMEFDPNSHQDSSTETRNCVWREIVLSKARKLFRDPGILGQRLQTENLPADIQQLIVNGLETKVGNETKAAKDLSTCTTNLQEEMVWVNNAVQVLESKA